MKNFLTIIVDNLTNDFAGIHEEFQKVQLHTGTNEVDRLMGAGDDFGKGPLPMFLRAAVLAKKAGNPVHIFYLRDINRSGDENGNAALKRFGRHNIEGTPGADFIPCLIPLIKEGRIIPTGSLALPLQEFYDFFEKIFKKNFSEISHEEKQLLTITLVGVHTELRILHAATFLRNTMGIPGVYISPHLVGSKDQYSHQVALQTGFPNSMVTVIPGLADFYDLCSVPHPEMNLQNFRACQLEPPEIKILLNPEQKEILEAMFLFHSNVMLRALSGGYSGSLLFSAGGERQGSKTAPVILKIDLHGKIRKELDGYFMVKDLLDKHIPSFQAPVSKGKYTGIRMELASMEGKPTTFQNLFESINSRILLNRFMGLFQGALRKLDKLLFSNTLKEKKFFPYREFEIQNAKQRQWLRENISWILGSSSLDRQDFIFGENVSLHSCISGFEKVTAFSDRVMGTFARCHGDLNFANIISDHKNNIWIIDWAYCGDKPVEIDFAKMENDLKFVLIKEWHPLDLPRLLAFETYLLQNLYLPQLSDLSDEMLFVREDIRYEKLYSAVKILRDTYRNLSRGQNPDYYWIALLKFATHTLSFDQRRNRGECNLTQLKFALISVCLLVHILRKCELHKMAHKDKPSDYPERFPVPEVLAPWELDIRDYHPPFYISESVRHASPGKNNDFYSPGMKNGKIGNQNAWSDPVDINLVVDLKTRTSFSGPILFDPAGYPLNPLGRTGIAGRGSLGKWGPNLAVDPVVTRLNPRNGKLELALVKRKESDQWGLPGTFSLPGESPAQAVSRSLFEKTGLKNEFLGGRQTGTFVIKDYRNTDNAWIESIVIHLHLQGEDACGLQTSIPKILDADWIFPSTELSKHLFANHAWLIRQTLEKLANLKGNLIPIEKIEEVLMEL